MFNHLSLPVSEPNLNGLGTDKSNGFGTFPNVSLAKGHRARIFSFTMKISDGKDFGDQSGKEELS